VRTLNPTYIQFVNSRHEDYHQIWWKAMSESVHYWVSWKLGRDMYHKIVQLFIYTFCCLPYNWMKYLKKSKRHTFHRTSCLSVRDQFLEDAETCLSRSLTWPWTELWRAWLYFHLFLIPPGGRSHWNTSTKFFQNVFGGGVKTNFHVKLVLKDLKLNVEIASKVHWQMLALSEKWIDC
jgi:hypothetical protein